ATLHEPVEHGVDDTPVDLREIVEPPRQLVDEVLGPEDSLEPGHPVGGAGEAERAGDLGERAHVAKIPTLDGGDHAHACADQLAFSKQRDEAADAPVPSGMTPRSCRSPEAARLRTERQRTASTTAVATISAVVRIGRMRTSTAKSGLEVILPSAVIVGAPGRWSSVVARDGWWGS